MIRIGFRELEGVRYPVLIRLSHFLYHQYILGATGTGKSTLIASEIVQAFEENACCVVIDPHGDLSINVIRAVNPGDLENVYLFDPLRVRFSLNPLELPCCDNRDIVAEKMIAEITEFFKKLYGVQYWGPSLNRIFQDGLRALYEKDDSPTLKDLYDLVSGKIQHREFQEELKRLPRGRTDSVLNKLAPFVKNAFVSRILCRKFSSLSLEELIAPKKLIVFRLPKGELSEIISVLIGSTIVTKLWFSAMSRSKDFPIILAIDEFHLFSHLETLRNMIAEGRKYGIGLILAHQHTSQLSQEFLGDVLSNSGIKVVFRVSGEDAVLISRNFGSKELAEKLVALPDGKAVVYISGRIFNEAKVFEISTLPLFTRNSFIDHVLNRMKELFEIEEVCEVVEDAEIFELINIIDSLRKEGEVKVSDIFEKYRSIKPGIRGSELSALLERAESLGFVTRHVVKQKRGRPKIVVELTEKAEEVLGYRKSKSTSAGGKTHEKLALSFAEKLRKNGFIVVFPHQGGGKEQPDIIAYRRVGDRWIETGVEIEVRADHPSQVLRNYEKNIRMGRDVIFVVPDDKIAGRVKRILGDREKYCVIVERIV